MSASKNFTSPISNAPNECDTIESPVRRAQQLIDTGQVTDALQLLDTTITREPSNAEAFVARGAIRRELRDYKSALNDFDKAIGLQPRYCWARLNRARFFWESGRLDDAADEFEFLTRELAPDVAEYHLEYARFLCDSKCWRDAIYSLDKAIRLKPGMEKAYLMRGSVAQGFARHDDAMTDLYQYLCLTSQRTRPAKLPNVDHWIESLLTGSGGTDGRARLATFKAARDKLSADRGFIGIPGSEFLPAAEVLTWVSNESNARLRELPTVRRYFQRMHLLSGGQCGKRAAGCAYEVLSDGTALLAVPQRLWGFVFLVTALLDDDAPTDFGPTYGNLFRALASASASANVDLSTLVYIIPRYLSRTAVSFGAATADLAMTFVALRETIAHSASVFDDSHYTSLDRHAWIWCNEIWSDTEAMRRLKLELPAELRGKADLRMWVHAVSAIFTFVGLHDSSEYSSDELPILPPPSLRLGHVAMELVGQDDVQRQEAVNYSEQWLECVRRLARQLDWLELSVVADRVHGSADGYGRYFEPRYFWFQVRLPEELSGSRQVLPAPDLPKIEPGSRSDYHKLIAQAVHKTPDESALPQRVFDAMLQYAASESERMAELLLRAQEHGVSDNLTSIEMFFVDDDNLERKGCYADYYEGGLGVVVIPITTAAALDVLGSLVETLPSSSTATNEEVAVGSDIPLHWRESLDRCRAVYAKLTRGEGVEGLGIAQAFANGATTSEKLAALALIREQRGCQTKDTEIAPSNLGLLAMMYLVAHEVAHHLKRHDEIFVAFRDRFPLTVPLGAVEWAQELEADSIAGRSSKFKMKNFDNDRIPQGFMVASHDGVTTERISVLRAELLLFGLVLLESIPNEEADEMETGYNSHPDLGIRLRSLREWCFSTHNEDNLYIAASLEFADKVWQMSQQVDCPALAALGAIALFDETSELEYRRVWECIEALDYVSAQLVIPGVSDDVLRPQIDEVGAKLRGVRDDN